VNEKNHAGNTVVELVKDTRTIEVLKVGDTTMPEIPEQKKNNLLLEYAHKGCMGGVLMSLQAGTNVNHKDTCLWTALHTVANYVSERTNKRHHHHDCDPSDHLLMTQVFVIVGAERQRLLLRDSPSQGCLLREFSGDPSNRDCKVGR
jgi:hypothetical protein